MAGNLQVDNTRTEAENDREHEAVVDVPREVDTSTEVPNDTENVTEADTPHKVPDVTAEETADTEHDDRDDKGLKRKNSGSEEIESGRQLKESKRQDGNATSQDLFEDLTGPSPLHMEIDNVDNIENQVNDILANIVVDLDIPDPSPGPPPVPREITEPSSGVPLRTVPDQELEDNSTLTTGIKDGGVQKLKILI